MNGPKITFRLPRERTGPRSHRHFPPATRLARQLALAYCIERLVEAGEIESYAAAAQRLGIGRARMAQILSLLNVSSGIQERILTGDLVSSERALRSVLREPNWKIQVALFS